LYLWIMSGNSLTSTASAVMRGERIASLWANLAARGQ
jgi:hypothetical protein